MSILARDNFDGDTTGALPSGWANGAGTWVVGTRHPVSGTKTLGSSSESSLDTVVYTGIAAAADMGVQFDQIIPAIALHGASISCLVRSNSAGTTFYTALLDNITGTTVDVTFFKCVAGSYIGLTNFPGITLSLSAGDTLHLRTSAVGNVLSVYMSTNTTSLPTTPQATITDSSITAAGYPGLLYSINGTTAPGIGADNFLVDTGAEGSVISVSPTSSSGSTGVASSNFTLSLDGSPRGNVVVTPSDSGGGGTFTPTTITLTTANPVGTFTYTPAGSAGSRTISFTNGQSLTNPSSVTYTVSSTAGLKYNRVDTTDTRTGQNIMVLVPSSGSAVPYSAANPTGVILYAHGAGETQTALTADTLKTSTVAALINAGFILAGTNAHGDNWGTQQSIDDYAALEQYVRTNYNVSNVCVWSQSMGGLDGLMAIAQNKVRAVGWLGTYPVTNLANLYGLGTYASAINTAHGITGSAPATYANRTFRLDPNLLQGLSWRNVPMRFYSSAGDTVVPKTQNTDLFKTLINGSARESVVVATTGDHGDPSNFVPSEYVAFSRAASRPRCRHRVFSAGRPRLFPVRSASARLCICRTDRPCR
jgi:fermentation-respiration switch protein FrsA (DUF1100 family)